MTTKIEVRKRLRAGPDIETRFVKVATLEAALNATMAEVTAARTEDRRSCRSLVRAPLFDFCFSLILKPNQHKY